MEWLRERVWQLGLAILLALVATALIYVGSADDANLDLVSGLGLVLFAIALAVPLASKAAKAAQEALDEEA
jgi:ABC-type uncharacterized transport system permease subunit